MNQPRPSLFDVPTVVRNKAHAAGAATWLEELPDLVAALEDEWSFDALERLDGGTESFVAAVERADGTPAVLKVLIPRDWEAARNEITALRLAGGEGCAVLVRADEARGAMLMERLGRPLSDLGRPVGERHRILAGAAARVWRPVPGGVLPTGADKAGWLMEAIATWWEELDRPCSERAVAHALACARRRAEAHDDERAVLVHGDVHQWNTLEAGSGFKLIDPDGLVAEPEYDLGIVMREDPVDLLRGDPRQRARRLAALTGRDALAIWEWGVVERVSTGLLCTRIDLQPVGRQMLETADRVAE